MTLFVLAAFLILGATSNRPATRLGFHLSLNRCYVDNLTNMRNWSELFKPLILRSGARNRLFQSR